MENAPTTLKLEGERPIRIVVVDDHAVLRAGTRQIFNEALDMEVVGEAANVAEALEVLRATEPDVVVVDIRLPDRNGIDLARQVVVEQLATTVVVLSAYDDDDYVRAALDAGVGGYLLKTMPGDELVGAVRAARAGMIVLDPALSARLAQRTPVSATAYPDSLTWREREVISLVADGLPNKVVAIRLGISARTVEGHLNHIFSKLGITSRTELVRLAISTGLVRMTPTSKEGPDHLDTPP